MLTTKDIERQLSSYRFVPVKNANRTDGDFKRLPVFMLAFDDFVKKYEKVPSYKEFENHYFAMNYSFFKRFHKGDETIKIARERCSRAYPSLIRDLHFTYLLKEHGLNNKYDLKDDVYGGVDQRLDYGGDTFFVHCFVDSELSRAARKSKNNYHVVTDHHIDLPIKIHGPDCKVVGDFRLYSEKHIESLKSMMDNILKDSR